MAGSAVATMVWSTTARNIGSMMEGKTVRNSRPGDGLGSMSSFMQRAPAWSAECRHHCRAYPTSRAAILFCVIPATLASVPRKRDPAGMTEMRAAR